MRTPRAAICTHIYLLTNEIKPRANRPSEFGRWPAARRGTCIYTREKKRTAAVASVTLSSAEESSLLDRDARRARYADQDLITRAQRAFRAPTSANDALLGGSVVWREIFLRGARCFAREKSSGALV